MARPAGQSCQRSRRPCGVDEACLAGLKLERRPAGRQQFGDDDAGGLIGSGVGDDDVEGHVGAEGGRGAAGGYRDREVGAGGASTVAVARSSPASSLGVESGSTTPRRSPGAIGQYHGHCWLTRATTSASRPRRWPGWGSSRSLALYVVHRLRECRLEREARGNHVVDDDVGRRVRARRWSA